MAKGTSGPKIHPWIKVPIPTLLKILEQGAQHYPMSEEDLELYLQAHLQNGLNRWGHDTPKLKILEYMPGYRRIESGSGWSRTKLCLWIKKTSWKQRYQGWRPGDPVPPIPQSTEDLSEDES